MLRELTWAVLLLVAALLAMPNQARADRVIDDSDRVVLTGNVHRKARPENDAGVADPDLPMRRMILALRQPPDKKAELERLLKEQHDPGSPNYRRWLTPEEFGTRFGASKGDIAVVTAWLKAQGFTVDEVSRSGGWINFSGKAATVKKAFKTEIHNYLVDGTMHHANSADPSIPRGLADLVAGISTLHDFPRKPMNQGATPVPLASQPEYTDGSYHYLAPGDFATIYNVSPLYSAGIDGTGQAIAVVGRTNPPTSDWTDFRTYMALPANTPQVVVNGPDPGSVSDNENFEADLDVEWAGAVAKNASVTFVTSQSTTTTDGVDLSAQYIVDNNLAPVMTTSFGLCEAAMGSTESTFYNNLWAQAAAQGITTLVSSGDSGAAGCDGGSASTGTVAAVNGIASTPYNVAVGGTVLDDSAGGYWGSTWQNVNYASALGYIPEIAWNESGSVSGGTGLWSTGGGASSLYAKPSWQVAPGVPADGKRDLPDVSLSAGTHDAYLIRSKGAWYTIGGTSASTPSFAGIMALVNHQTGQRQGNANTTLYQLAATQYGNSGATVFHDVTSGNNTVPGVTGYSCSAGYDLATGLGSVDVTALVTQWPNSTALTVTAGTTSLSAIKGKSATSTISVLTSLNSDVSLSVSGLPAGTSASFAPATIAAPGNGSSTLTLTTTSSTPTGSYPITVTATSGSTTSTASFTLAVYNGPDLQVTAVSGSITNGVLSYSATVKNFGDTTAGASSTAIYLSAGGTDTPVTTVNTTTPGPGSDTTLTGSYPVPAALVPGSYSVVAVADINNTVAESDETNNRGVSATTVAYSNDLSLSALSGTVSAGKLTYSVAVNNSGNGNPSVPVAFYLSSDNIATTSDYLVTQVTNNFPGGSSKTLTGTVSIPTTIPSGTYYLTAIADPANALPEADESNNTALGNQLAISNDVDLSVSSVSASIAAGKVSYSVTVQNTGNVAAASSTTSIYLSANGTDKLLASLYTGSIPAGGQVTITAYAYPTLTPGSYTVVAVADSKGVVTETDETNNRAAGNTITVTNDLSLSALSGSLSGGKLTYSVTVSNGGTGSASAPVALYLSTDGSATSYLLGQAGNVSVAGGSSTTVSGTITVPGGIPTGSYYLIAKADPANIVAETDESNNTTTAAGVFPVNTDLQVSAVSGSLAAGKLSYSITISNAGNVATAASSTGIYLSAGGTDTLLSTITTPTIAAGTQYTLTGTVFVPSTTPPGTYSVVALADMKGIVAESDETNNRGVAAATVSLGNDLTLSGLSASLSAGKISYSVTLANGGTGNPTVPVSLYFSTSSTPSTGGYLIGQVNAGSVPGGTSMALSGTMNVPGTVPTGAYYLVAVADPANTIAETDESNNGATGPQFSVNSDLQPSAVSGSVSAGKVSYSATMANAGNIAAGASSTAIYLSAGGTDTLLTTVTTPSIAAGSQYTASGSISVPPTLPPGTYSIVAVADSKSVVAESNESNNRGVSATTVTVSNDLSLSALSGSVSSGKLTYSVTVTNSGSGNPTVPVSLYFSTDSTPSTSDYLVTQISPASVPGGSSLTLSGTVAIPGTIPSGTFYLVALADPANTISETNESNNGATGGQFTVNSDLQVSAVSGSLASGKLAYSVTVANAGNIAAGASSTGIYLSAGGTDTLLATLSTPSIATGASQTLTGTVAIPATLAPGSYSVVAVADTKGTVQESDETNNRSVAATAVVLSNDLALSGLTGTVSGGKLSYSVTISNSGTGNPSVPIAFYFSTDNVPATSDYLIGNSYTVNVPGGTSTTVSGTITVPGSVPSGTYYLVALADPANSVAESNESNNGTYAGQFTVNSDLQVSAVSASLAAGRVSYSVTVANTGNIAASASSTGLYLSANGTDTLIATLSTGSIPAGGQLTFTGTTLLPASLPPGTYSVAAVADMKGIVSESDESNNRTVAAGTVTVSNDLTLSGLSGSLSAGKLTYSVTLANSGTGNPSAPVALYFATDSSASGTKYLITQTGNISIHGGASTAVSGTVTVPGGIPSGTYYLVAVADPGNVVAESNEGNNGTSGGQFSIGSDLVVSAISGSVLSGKLTYSVTVSNTGNIAAGSSTTGVYLSNGGTDTLVTSLNTYTVPAGGQLTITGTSYIPSTIPSGVYSVVGIADTRGVVSETDETNNRTVAATSVVR